MIQINIAHKEYSDAQGILFPYAMNKNLCIRIDFGADHTQSKIIRDFVGKIFEYHNINAPWKGRFILITDELINNAIEHGSIQGDLDTCIIQAEKKIDGTFSIALEVHDTGRGKNIHKVAEILSKRTEFKNQRNVVSMEKRGRGLFHITEKLVDRLEFTESPKGGLAVKIEKQIPSTIIQGDIP